MIALVLGCGENVWEDSQQALAMFNPDAIFAVKDMMARWPFRIDYGITLHPDRTDSYLRERQRHGWSTGFQVWAHRNFGSQTAHRTADDWAGSSGLFAVRVAMYLGFEGIVLAGVPMDPAYGHIVRRQQWNGAQDFRNGWTKRKDQIAPFTRSMSGWTKEIFGGPSEVWLKTLDYDLSDPRFVDLLGAYLSD
jgi:hypothetical protein